AALRGEVDIIEYLIKEGANTRTKAGSDVAAPLHLAVYEGHKAAVEKLLDLDNLPKPHSELEAKFETRPIHIAAYRNHPDILELLIYGGVDINSQKKDKFTALIWSALKGYDKVTQWLLKKGAEKNIQNSRGHTALQIA